MSYNPVRIASFSSSYNPVHLIVRCALSMKIKSFEANFLYCALYTGAPYSLENTVLLLLFQEKLLYLENSFEVLLPFLFVLYQHFTGNTHITDS